MLGTLPSRPLAIHENKPELFVKTGDGHPPVHLHGCRVGEAQNPGPPMTAKQRRDVDTATRFYDFSGQNVYGTRGRDTSNHATYSLRITTANGTGWGPLKQFILSCPDDVITVQEHHLPRRKVSRARAWALRNGWTSFWGAALENCEENGSSGGTAIFIRSGIGADNADLTLPPSNRAVAAFIDPPGGVRTMVVSAYLQHGVGFNDTNLNLLQQVGEGCAAWKGPFVIGADFNNTPEQLDSLSFASKIKATIVAPYAPRGTCTGNGNGTLIDYFVVSDDLVSALADTCVNYCSGLSPHRPSSLGFHPRVANILARHLSKPQKIDTHRIIGPLWQSPKWEEIQVEADSIFRCSNMDNQSAVATCMKRNEWLLPKIADALEDELVRNVGCDVPKARKRCRGINSSWKPIVSKSLAQPQCSAAARWALQLAKDLKQVPAFGEDAQEGFDNWWTETGHGYQTAVDASSRDSVKKAIDDVWELRRKVKFDPAAISPSDVDDFIVQLVEVYRKCVLEDVKAARTGYKDWLLEDLHQGGRRAHLMTKLPAEWSPSSTQDSCGVVTSDPATVFESERAEFGTLWEALNGTKQRGQVNSSTETEGSQAKSGTSLPRLTHKSLRSAGNTFSHCTTATYDGVHPRHFALLSDAALQVVAVFLESIENLGAWPPGIDTVAIALIPKPKGGVRPIGLFPGLHRLWSRARRDVAQAWCY